MFIFYHVDERIAFYTYRISSCLASAPVKFEHQTVNEGLNFNINTSSFTAPSDGYYWFHLTAHIPAFTMCDYRLVGTHQSRNVIRMHTRFNQGTFSRDDVQLLTKGEAIYVTSDYSLATSRLAHSSFAGFRMDSLFKPFIVFVVGSSEVYSRAGPIQFRTVLIDPSRSWNTSRNEFIAPYSGIYFFTINTGAAAGSSHVVHFTINQRSFVKSLMIGDQHKEAETVSRSTMAQLASGDAVGVVLDTGSIYSDIRYQTSFMGFLYEPITKESKVAWSVHTDRNISDSTDPIPFNYILVNEASGWYSNQRFITPIGLAGVYYVHINARPTSGTMLELQILHNGRSIASLTHTGSSSYNYESSRSRATIIRLQDGDELRIALIAGSLSGDPDRCSSFSGFRLFA